MVDMRGKEIYKTNITDLFHKMNGNLLELSDNEFCIMDVLDSKDLCNYSKCQECLEQYWNSKGKIIK